MHILKLPLETTEYDELVLEQRFRLLCRGHNILVKHAKKLLRELKRNKTYRRLLDEYHVLKDQKAKADAAITAYTKSAGKKAGKRDNSGASESKSGAKSPSLTTLKAEQKAVAKKLSEVTKALYNIRDSIGLTDEKLQAYTKVFQNQHDDHLSSQMMQVEASRVWRGVEKVLFGNGRDVHYKKVNELHTLGCKSATNGIRYYDDWHIYTPKTYTPKHRAGVEYLGLDTKVWSYQKVLDDPYKVESLGYAVKYACISREMFDSGWRYYVILTLDGPAPLKISDEERMPGTMGGDTGPSTLAASGPNGIILEELAPRCAEYNKQITGLMRKIDRSTRMSNPDNYNPDGTCKKKRAITGWKFSKTCRRDKRKLKAVFRRKAEYTRHEHNNRANRIVRMCDVYVNEKIEFSALAKRSTKETTRSDKVSKVKKKDGTVRNVHKCNRKKRFGKSINDRSPAAQDAVIERKMLQYGCLYLETNTRTMKASQYRHDTGQCEKVPLATRSKVIDNHDVQRDLYSSFITGHADAELKHPDQAACIRDFRWFCYIQDDLIASMKTEGKSRPWCFGF